MSRPPIPSKVVKKFDHDGNSLLYRGHSVICPLPTSSPLALALWDLRQTLSGSSVSSLFANEALLPAYSWHMTVFIGVRDLERGKDVMPRDGYGEDIKARSGLVGPYEEWLDYSIGSLQAMPQDAATAPPYTLELDPQIPALSHSINLKLRPSAETNTKLQALRQQIAYHLGIGFTPYDAYHVTLAYLLREPTDEEKAEIQRIVELYISRAPREVQFDMVGLFSFEDMQTFMPQVTLGSV